MFDIYRILINLSKTYIRTKISSEYLNQKGKGTERPTKNGCLMTTLKISHCYGISKQIGFLHLKTIIIMSKEEKKMINCKLYFF